MAVYKGSGVMTLIKVDPSLLQSSGQDIQSNAQNISSAGSSVLGAASSAPSYNGQFGPQVSAIGQEAYSRLGNSSNQLNDLGARLSLKGVEFQAVDDAGLSEIGSLQSDPIFAFTDPGTNLSALTESSTDPFLRLGSLINTAGQGINKAWTFIVSGGSFWAWKGSVWEKETPTTQFGIGNIRLGSENKEYTFDEGEAGVGIYGAYAGLKGFNAQEDKWIGNKNLGVTQEDTLTLSDYGGFAGYHDGELGAKVSADLASTERDFGLNIAGANVGVSGKISLGIDAGGSIGKKGVKVAVPILGIVSVEVGLHTGPAIGN